MPAVEDRCWTSGHIATFESGGQAGTFELPGADDAAVLLWLFQPPASGWGGLEGFVLAECPAGYGSGQEKRWLLTIQCYNASLNFTSRPKNEYFMNRG